MIPIAGRRWSPALTVEPARGSLGRSEHPQQPMAGPMLPQERERLHREWSAWAKSNLGADPDRTEGAATAAVEAISAGRGYKAALEAAKEAWRAGSPNLRAGAVEGPLPHDLRDASLTQVAASKARQNVVGERSPDGVWEWDGYRWNPTDRTREAYDRRLFRRGQGSAALAAFLAGWLVNLAFGTQLLGAVASLAAALVTSTGIALMLAARHPMSEPDQRRGAGAAALGVGVTVAMAPIWVVRPFFADESGVARGVPISLSAHAVWVLFAILSSIVVAVSALIVARITLGKRLTPRPVESTSGHAWLSAIHWRPLVWFISIGLIFTLGTAALSVDAAQSDQIPTAESTTVFLPSGPLPIICPVQSMSQYVNGDESLAQRSGGRTLADSWRLMKSNGVIEGSVGLLVTTPGQCSGVVDADPWVQTWVFRFDNGAHALKMYQAGLLGIIPTADPRKQRPTDPNFGWADDLNASWMEYVNTGSQTQFTAFWPYSNYLVFFICNNVESTECKSLVYPVGGDYSSSSIQSKLDDAVRSGKWFYVD